MFELIMAVILKHEGGYVNDPDDLGGETKYGITKRNYPNLDIKNLTRAEAIEIYKRDFYIPLKIAEFTNMNLALNYMDMAVNAGKKNAKELMDMAKIRQEKNGGALLQHYKDLRKEYYQRIAEYRNNKKYLKGWLSRVDTSYIA